MPEQVSRVKNKEYLFFEQGYGKTLGFADDDYLSQGAKILPKEEVLSKDVICDPKIGDSDYLTELKKDQIVFGYVHAVQNRDITDSIINNSLTAIAWEDMFEGGRNVFWRNNELAGEGAIMHAFTLYGKLPYECKVALIGRGNVAHGAYRILASLGADIVLYNRKMEGLLRKEIENYDVVVNAVLWDTRRDDHIIPRAMLKKMKKNAMIIDISCDKEGAVETSVPTTIGNPVYLCEGIKHYVVDHTPSLIANTASRAFGNELVKYLDYIIEDNIEKNNTLRKATIIRSGNILDENIIDYQNR